MSREDEVGETDTMVEVLTKRFIFGTIQNKQSWNGKQTSTLHESLEQLNYR